MKAKTEGRLRRVQIGYLYLTKTSSPEHIERVMNSAVTAINTAQKLGKSVIVEAEGEALRFLVRLSK